MWSIPLEDGSYNFWFQNNYKFNLLNKDIDLYYEPNVFSTNVDVSLDIAFSSYIGSDVSNSVSCDPLEEQLTVSHIFYEQIGLSNLSHASPLNAGDSVEIAKFQVVQFDEDSINSLDSITFRLISPFIHPFHGNDDSRISYSIGDDELQDISDIEYDPCKDKAYFTIDLSNMLPSGEIISIYYDVSYPKPLYINTSPVAFSANNGAIISTIIEEEALILSDDEGNTYTPDYTSCLDPSLLVLNNSVYQEGQPFDLSLAIASAYGENDYNIENDEPRILYVSGADCEGLPMNITDNNITLSLSCSLNDLDFLWFTLIDPDYERFSSDSIFVNSPVNFDPVIGEEVDIYTEQDFLWHYPAGFSVEDSDYFNLCFADDDTDVCFQVSEEADNSYKMTDADWDTLKNDLSLVEGDNEVSWYVQLVLNDGTTTSYDEWDIVLVERKVNFDPVIGEEVDIYTEQDFLWHYPAGFSVEDSDYFNLCFADDDTDVCFQVSEEADNSYKMTDADWDTLKNDLSLVEGDNEVSWYVQLVLNDGTTTSYDEWDIVLKFVEQVSEEDQEESFFDSWFNPEPTNINNTNTTEINSPSNIEVYNNANNSNTNTINIGGDGNSYSYPSNHPQHQYNNHYSTQNNWQYQNQMNVIEQNLGNRLDTNKDLIEDLQDTIDELLERLNN